MPVPPAVPPLQNTGAVGRALEESPRRGDGHRGRGPRVARRVGVSALVLAALVAVAASDPLHRALTAGVAIVEPVFAARPVLGAVLFVALSALSALVAFFSSSALIPVALDVWGPVATGGLLWAGWTLGGVGSYAAGRWIGRPAVARLDRAGRVGRTLGRIRPDTPLWLVVLLQLALQSELSGALLGMARYPFSRYLLALTAVEAALVALAVAVGTGLVERDAGLLVGAGALFVAAGAAALIVHRRLPPASP